MGVDLDQVRAFYRATPNKKIMSAYSYLVFSDGTTNIVQGYACHGSATNLDTRVYNHDGKYLEKTVVICSGGILPGPDELEVVMTAWKWATGKFSPWRSLFPNGVELVLRNDGSPCGWIIEGEYLKDIPFALMKNFMIFTRSLTERYDAWSFWYDLVTNHKMKRSDAAFIITTIYRNGTDYSDHASRSGGHFPFTDYGGACLSVKRLMTGQLRKTPVQSGSISVNINYHFCADEPAKKKFNICDVKFTVQGSRFGPERRFYKVEDIIAYYYEWKKEHGK